jgi:hypothetical protein
LDDIRVLVFLCHRKRRKAELVLGGDVGAVFDEQFDDFAVPEYAGFDEGGSALFRRTPNKKPVCRQGVAPGQIRQTGFDCFAQELFLSVSWCPV